jgi:hypothetical protein
MVKHNASDVASVIAGMVNCYHHTIKETFCEQEKTKNLANLMRID